MSEPKQKQPPIDLGIYGRDEKPAGIGTTEAVAVGLSLLWMLVVVGFMLFVPGEGGASVNSLNFVMVLLAIFLPVALIWVAATAVLNGKRMREDSARLRASVDALRQSYIQSQQSGASGVKPAVEKKLEEIAAAQRKTEDAIATFTSVRPETRPAGPPKPAMPQPGVAEEQGSLALNPTAEEQAKPVNVSDFIRALNFPENADDAEGFRALRRALQDRQTAQLVQASQDVLTLLAQDGIYMDDLRPDRARPEIWRRFARGERGRTTAALGGVRDRSCLALAAGRMRQDTVFRDSAHHFLRLFDKMLAAFETHASDADIAALADTRTARSFMLLGRVAGTFD